MSHVTFNQSEAVFPWDHVVITCIDHMVSIAPSDHWVTCFHGKTKEFATPTSWLMAEAATSLERVNMLNPDPPPRPKRHRRNMSDSYLFDSHHLPTLTPSHPAHLRQASQSPLATKLVEKIGTEKQLSIDFEEQLKKVLREGKTPHTPLLTPSPPPRHDDHTPSSLEWAGSLEVGLQLLKMKIRTSRFQEKMDRHKLQMLANTRRK
ncbi:hypothetical protein GBAR_LOCUS1332 [Geodia barretti]|uniref:Uncharacterized protein n=1 Tax=Geodia barretti TaxID=519541 RepID=A0AA35QW99_GEOBA|nr:hypothetical protein GBAR_LOCUS1332 [Geodia barretti]